MKHPSLSGSKLSKIWIDLDNSPHVPFFYPIIKKLENDGYSVLITARDCFQVCGLADRFKFDYRKVGRHFGKNIILKVFGNLMRAMQLLVVVKKEKSALYVSHGSRAGMIAAALLNIPIITIIDYEFAEKIPFINPVKILVPEIVSAENYGPNKNRVIKYPGIKEDVYVPDFKPDPTILNELGISEEELLVTIRPPATEAHYHNPESEILFETSVNHIGKFNASRMVILPRNEVKQTKWIKSNWPEWVKSGKIIIPEHVVDGLNLMWFSDFVISGGGTMNREAAALDIPVYSIFRGKIGAVDRYLSNNGRLILLTSVEDVKQKIKLVKREKSEDPIIGKKTALNKIVEEIIDSIEN